VEGGKFFDRACSGANKGEAKMLVFEGVSITLEAPVSANRNLITKGSKC
jgi:hypothetical protein